MEKDSNTILVFSAPPVRKEYLDRGDNNRRPIRVDIDTLQVNVDEFLVAVESIIPKAKKKIKGFQLSEIHISAEVDAEGQIGLLGTGITAGASAGFTFVLRRG